MNRRTFLTAIAAGFAPAVAGEGVLMPIRKLIVPEPELVINHFLPAENMHIAKMRAFAAEQERRHGAILKDGRIYFWHLDRLHSVPVYEP